MIYTREDVINKLNNLGLPILLSKNDEVINFQILNLNNYCRLLIPFKFSDFSYRNDELCSNIAFTLSFLDTLRTFERTLHFKIWHDAATILGRGYILILAALMYDEAVHVTGNEYFREHGVRADVQELVERPHLFARSADSIDDQLLYTNERNKDLAEMSKPVFSKEGITFHDIIRLFIGDHPACAFEAGNSIGGKFPCVVCCAKAINFGDLTYCFRSKCLSPQER